MGRTVEDARVLGDPVAFLLHVEVGFIVPETFLTVSTLELFGSQALHHVWVHSLRVVLLATRWTLRATLLPLVEAGRAHEPLATDALFGAVGHVEAYSTDTQIRHVFREAIVRVEADRDRGFRVVRG